MVKLYLWDKESPLMLPNGVAYTPEQIMQMYPLTRNGAVVLENLTGEIVGAIDSLQVLRGVFGVDESLSDDQAVREIERIKSAPPEPEPSPEPAEIKELQEQVEKLTSDLVVANVATILMLPAIPEAQARAVAYEISKNDISTEPFIPGNASKPMQLRKGHAYHNTETGVRGVWMKDDAKTWDPNWAPGISYANYMTLPEYRDGYPVWQMGIYSVAGDLWWDPVNNKLYKAKKDFGPWVHSPSQDPSSWELQ